MIIVTGGAGFIGSNLLKGLEDAGHSDIVVCDWLGTEEKWRNISKRGLRDVICPEEMLAFLHKHANNIEIIYNMGAISSTIEQDADLIVRSNIRLTLDLWDFCRDHDVRLVYASSAATYGDGEAGFEDVQDGPSLARFQPLNAYGWSKQMVDRRIIDGIEKKGEKTPPQWAGLKFFNVYGPNEYHKGGQKSVVAHLFPQIQETGQAKLFKSYHPDYADGGQLRDFIWVGDCVDVMVWLYDNPQVSGLLNVGTGQARSFDDLAKSTFSGLKQDVKIEYIEMPKILRGKYQYYTQASVSKIQSLGYKKSFTSLEDGVERYVRDYLMQEDPFL